MIWRIYTSIAAFSLLTSHCALPDRHGISSRTGVRCVVFALNLQLLRALCDPVTVDSLRPLAEYKAMEEQMNTLGAAFAGECGNDVAKGAAKYEAITGTKPNPEDYKPIGQDFVEQAP